MKRSRISASIFIFLILTPSVLPNPFSLLPKLPDIGKHVRTAYNKIKCQFYECCSDLWINLNISGLQKDLKREVHGQHLVVDAVVRAIQSHVSEPKPMKALVLSFHGLTGTGKNYVSSIIARNLYKKGTESRFVHQFVASHHFTQKELLPYYRQQIKEWIHSNVSECGWNLFIFDEMDKMPDHLIDTIKPYIDFYENVDHVDFRKSIFIFLSNTASYDITYQALQHFYTGKKREELNLMPLQDVITQAAFNEGGGLWHSTLIEHHLIDLFIPFLPMEKRHVRKCIEDKLSVIHFSTKLSAERREELISQTVNHIPYFPKREQIYSESGCKRVGHIIMMLLYDVLYENVNDEL